MKTVFLLLGFILLNISNVYARPTVLGGAVNAENIYVRDTAGNYTSITVEDVLAEISTATGTITNLYLLKSGAATIYLQLDGLNADQLLNIGIYGVRSSSGIFGITSIDWGDGTVQVSSPTGGVDTNTQNVPTYAIVIASFSGVGITFSTADTSSFTAQKIFQLADDLAVAGDTIFVRGGLYVLIHHLR